MTIIERAKEWYPELLGTFTAMICALFSYFGYINFAPANLSLFSSTVLQVLATYTGLVLTAYTIFHGMKLNSADFVQSRTKDLQGDIIDARDGIHEVFMQGVWSLALMTLISCLVYFITLLGLPFILEGDGARTFNGVVSGMLLGFVVSSTSKIIGAVKCLFVLRGL